MQAAIGERLMETLVIRVYSLCTSNYPFPRRPVTYPFPHVRRPRLFPREGLQIDSDYLLLPPPFALFLSLFVPHENVDEKERKKEKSAKSDRKTKEGGENREGGLEQAPPRQSMETKGRN